MIVIKEIEIDLVICNFFKIWLSFFCNNYMYIIMYNCLYVLIKLCMYELSFF